MALKLQNNERDKCLAAIKRFEELESEFEQWIGTQEYSQELVDALVEKIEIHNNGDIDIRFKCEDVFADFKDLIQEEA